MTITLTDPTDSTHRGAWLLVVIVVWLTAGWTATSVEGGVKCQRSSMKGKNAFVITIDGLVRRTQIGIPVLTVWMAWCRTNVKSKRQPKQWAVLNGNGQR